MSCCKSYFSHNSVCQCSECNIRNKKYSCSVGKFLPVQSGDQHIQRLKNRAIGRGTLAKQYGDNHVASFSGSNDKKSINYQNTQQALRRLRNRGYVVPPKVVANRNAVGTCLNSENFAIYIIAYRDDGNEFGEFSRRTSTRSAEVKIEDSVFKSSSESFIVSCGDNSKLNLGEAKYSIVSENEIEDFKNGLVKKSDLTNYLTKNELEFYIKTPNGKVDWFMYISGDVINIKDCERGLIYNTDTLNSTITLKLKADDINL